MNLLRARLTLPAANDTLAASAIDLNLIAANVPKVADIVCVIGVVLTPTNQTMHQILKLRAMTTDTVSQNEIGMSHFMSESILNLGEIPAILSEQLNAQPNEFDSVSATSPNPPASPGSNTKTVAPLDIESVRKIAAELLSIDAVKHRSDIGSRRTSNRLRCWLRLYRKIDQDFHGISL